MLHVFKPQLELTPEKPFSKAEVLRFILILVSLLDRTCKVMKEKLQSGDANRSPNQGFKLNFKMTHWVVKCINKQMCKEKNFEKEKRCH